MSHRIVLNKDVRNVLCAVKRGGLSLGLGASWLLLACLSEGCADPEGAAPTIPMIVPAPVEAASETPGAATLSPSPSTPTEWPGVSPSASSSPPGASPTENPPSPSPTSTPGGPTPSTAPTPTATPTPTPEPTQGPTPTQAPDWDSDGYPPSLDCDDTNAQTYPGALESCDGLDNNCDGTLEGEADADLDAFRLCDSPADCNDADATVFPGATDLCDGIDQDCDGSVDEDGLTLWFGDSDGDGWGSGSVTTLACQAPPGYTSASGDCNDGDATIHPEASELCDQVDNNCNSQVDEALDLDLDGFTPCGAPADCDDQNSAVYPGATESCDGVDQNCDGDLDSAWKTPRGFGHTVTQSAPAGPADGTSAHPFPTIQQAINVSTSQCSVIWVNPGTYPENLSFQGHSALVIGAYGSENTVVNGGGKDSVARIDKSSRLVRLEGLTLESGKANRGGGISCTGSTLELFNVVVDSNTALEFGGGLWSDGCIVDGMDTAFLNNVARASAGATAGAGGGLYADGGRVELDTVTFVDGTTYQFGGGAAFLDGAEAIIRNSQFEQNTVGTYAFAQGGGIYSAYSHLQVYSSTFVGNTANNQGGGIWLSGCSLSDAGEPCQLENVWFEGNKTITGGGAGMGIAGIGAEGTSMDIRRCTFTGNIANGGGGGLALLQSSPRVINSVFHCNSGTNGGGMYLDGSFSEILHNTILENNVTQNGGGIYFSDSSTSSLGVRIINNVVYRNLRNGIAHSGVTTSWVFLNNDVVSNGVGNQNWIGVADPTGTNGNISIEPGFQTYKTDCDLKGDNFEPMNNSPLLDAASDPLVSEDIRAKHRPVDGNRDGVAVSDIGAYERQ